MDILVGLSTGKRVGNAVDGSSVGIVTGTLVGNIVIGSFVGMSVVPMVGLVMVGVFGSAVGTFWIGGNDVDGTLVGKFDCVGSIVGTSIVVVGCTVVCLLIDGAFVTGTNILVGNMVDVSGVGLNIVSVGVVTDGVPTGTGIGKLAMGDCCMGGRIVVVVGGVFSNVGVTIDVDVVG